MYIRTNMYCILKHSMTMFGKTQNLKKKKITLFQGEFDEKK